MTRRLIDTSLTMKVIRDTSKTEPRLDPAQLAAALGAELVPDVEIAGGSPLTLLAVRQELFRRLQSTGGRPALEGATRRVKIPLTDKQWHELETIAAALASENETPSAGQVASVLLDLALQAALDEPSLAKSKVPLTKEQISARLAPVGAKS